MTNGILKAQKEKNKNQVRSKVLSIFLLLAQLMASGHFKIVTPHSGQRGRK